MKTRHAVLLTAILATAIPSAAFAVEAGTLDIETDQLAKIAKQKAKRPATLDTPDTLGQGFNGNVSSPCGNVEIGNVTNIGPQFGAPREVTVIVTGDVINAGNNCRR